MIRAAQGRQANVVFIAPLPDFTLIGGWSAFTTANCTKQWFRREVPEYCFMHKGRQETIVEIAPITQRLRHLEKTHTNFRVYDGLPLICPPDKKACSNYIGSTRLYSDYSHLNRAGSLLLTQDFQGFLRDNGIL